MLAAGVPRSFAIHNVCGVPTTAKAYDFNVTVVPPGPRGYITAWPTGQTQPFVSTTNSLDGQVTANMAIVPAGSGTGGSVSFFALHINGYFAPPGSPGELKFYPVTPCRIADTRNAAGTFGGPILGSNETRTFPVPQSSCGLPAQAGGYSLNITAVPPGGLGYLTTWPTGQTQPYVSTLTALDGQVTANAAIVPSGVGGAINVFVLHPSHVVIDTNGYFAP